MKSPTVRSLALALCILFLFDIGAFADVRPEVFKVRLSPLGVTAATVNIITGSGTATATLEGTRLKVDVVFEGLTGAATSANIRRGPKGIPGPVVFELEIPKASSGTISAMLDL